MTDVVNNYGQNQEQGANWNSKTGQAWVNNDLKMDLHLEVITTLLFKEFETLGNKHVLDVGCGSGTTSKLLSDQVGSTGSVEGVDISRPLLELAQAKYGTIENIRFTNADAQSFEFKKSFYDQIVSRFGVMFFENPIAAFTNMRQSLKPNGKLNFVCWSALEENEFFILPLKIVLKYLNKPLPNPSKAPGPLAFSNKPYLLKILQSSEFKNIKIKTVKTEMLNFDPVKEQVRFFNKMGLAARMKKEASFDIEIHEKIDQELEIELMKRTDANGTSLKATVYYVSANA
jgi:ubiquinone/menaquinone biosynthesis C-methylase UbiE|tara:strand:+ start:1724 stop:2584 length:861 start_codon:yes stop_codon:yes gene_type:complete